MAGRGKAPAIGARCFNIIEAADTDPVTQALVAEVGDVDLKGSSFEKVGQFAFKLLTTYLRTLLGR